MDKQTFNTLVSRRAPLEPSDMAMLRQLVDGFPYCQTARVLIAKGFTDSGNMYAGQKLRSAAVYAASRSVLRTFVHDKELSETLSLRTPEVKPEPAAQPAIPQEQKKAEPELPAPVTPPAVAESLPAPAIQPKPGTDFYSELQRNLQELKSLRDHLTHDPVLPPATIEAKIIEREPEAIAELPVEETIIAAVEDVASVEEISAPDAHVQDATPADVFEYITRYQTTDSWKSDSWTDSRTGEWLTGNDAADIDCLLQYLHLQSVTTDSLKKIKIREAQNKLIEKFVKSADSFKPVRLKPQTFTKETSGKEDLSERAMRELDGPVTEIMANLYIKQQKYAKAIDIYKKLILKNPEKRLYFAQKILEAEQNL